jgi:GAF domain-containing protein
MSQGSNPSRDEAAAGAGGGPLSADLGESARAGDEHAAVSDILRLLARSPDLQPALDRIAQSAARLCGASSCRVFQFDGTVLHLVASHRSTPRSTDEPRQTGPSPAHGSAAGRAVLSGAPVQIEDTQTDRDGALDGAAMPDGRSILAVPISSRGAPVGAIAVGRSRPGPFAAAQVKTLDTFADLAGIALDNVRLTESVQARTRELEEALEHQTATSEVLNVISRSPSELQPVLDSIVATARRLCDAEFTFVYRLREDGRYHLAAADPQDLRLVDYLSRHPRARGDGSLTGRIAAEARTIHLPDATVDPEYRWSEWLEFSGFRTLLSVPLLRDGVAMGVIALARAQVKPFSDRQVQLVTTFAEQAAIAVQNVRLFEQVQERTRELQESLEYQTATSEVLNVISRSPSDLQPVLDSIVAIAGRLCEAYDAAIVLRDGDWLKKAAHRGPIPIDFTRWLIAGPFTCTTSPPMRDSRRGAPWRSASATGPFSRPRFCARTSPSAPS